MRMWMLDPSCLCRQHLLGEHNEIHMLAGTLLRGGKVDGFVDKGLLEIQHMTSRHEELVQEMLARGYKHASPLPPVEKALKLYPTHIQNCRVDKAKSQTELLQRCTRCAALYAVRTDTTEEK